VDVAGNGADARVANCPRTIPQEDSGLSCVKSSAGSRPSSPDGCSTTARATGPAFPGTDTLASQAVARADWQNVWIGTSFIVKDARPDARASVDEQTSEHEQMSIEESESILTRRDAGVYE
jgi:hypothetical protein